MTNQTKTATQSLNELQSKLSALKTKKVNATNDHSTALKDSIDELKSLFSSVSEIKSIDPKNLSRLITKKTNVKLEDDTKKILKIAHRLICGYKVKKELLTLSQIEKITTFSKDICNSFMKLNDEEYLDAIKEQIKEAYETKSTNVFSTKKARGL